MKKSVWLVPLGIKQRTKQNEYEEMGYSITLENIDFSIRTNKEFNQIYLTLNTDEIVLLRNSINKMLRK